MSAAERLARGITDAQAEVLERLVRRADAGGAAGIDLHVVTSEVAATPQDGASARPRYGMRPAG